MGNSSNSKIWIGLGVLGLAGLGYYLYDQNKKGKKNEESSKIDSDEASIDSMESSFESKQDLGNSLEIESNTSESISTIQNPYVAKPKRKTRSSTTPKKTTRTSKTKAKATQASKHKAYTITKEEAHALAKDYSSPQSPLVLWATLRSMFLRKMVRESGENTKHFIDRVFRMHKREDGNSPSVAIGKYFAIAISTLQKRGLLEKGTKTPTRKGLLWEDDYIQRIGKSKLHKNFLEFEAIVKHYHK